MQLSLSALPGGKSYGFGSVLGPGGAHQACLSSSSVLISPWGVAGVPTRSLALAAIPLQPRPRRRSSAIE